MIALVGVEDHSLVRGQKRASDNEEEGFMLHLDRTVRLTRSSFLYCRLDVNNCCAFAQCQKKKEGGFTHGSEQKRLV